MLRSLNHVFGLEVGTGMHVNVAVLVLHGISCGILTGVIWCPSNQMALPLLSCSSFGTRDGNKWEPLITCWRESHFCCYFTYRTDLFTDTILNMSTSRRMLTKCSRPRFTHLTFYDDRKRHRNFHFVSSNVADELNALKQSYVFLSSDGGEVWVCC